VFLRTRVVPSYGSPRPVREFPPMPVLKLLLVFTGIVLLLSRRWNLGLVLVVGSVAVSLLFGHPLSAVGHDFLSTSVDLLTLRLVLSVVLIMTLSELLRETASLKRMVEALQALVPSGRLVIAALPSLIGLLPMVGGAMFSAPMVDEVGDRLGADQERKTFVNYWFRHIWEYVFPLYPSFILAAALLNLETLQLAKATWPLTAAAVAGGIGFGLLGMARNTDDGPSPPPLESVRTLAASVWPVAMVIILSLGLPLDERATLIISLIATIVLMMGINRIPVTRLGYILHERIPWETIAVLFGALIFRRVLENSGAVRAVSGALTRSGVPVAVVAFIVPFIAGLLTGISAGAFSIGFPVILPLVAADGAAIASGWAAWLMAAGFLGVMCSPLHLCLSLTRVYFGAEWGPIYRRIVPSSLGVAAIATVLLLNG
jgi:integral membrane protein (TIGR00529 family)